MAAKGMYRGYEYLSNNNKTMGMDLDLELEIKTSRRELRLPVFHECCLDRKTREATSNMSHTIGKDVPFISAGQHQLHRFKNRNFKLDNLPHTGRLLQVDTDLLKQLIEENPRLTTRCLAERLECIISHCSGKISAGI